MSTIFQKYNYDGAIMLTASHLPYNRNGMKFFIKSGGLEKNDISDILSRAEVIDFIDNQKIENVSGINLMQSYSDHLINFIIKKQDPRNL